MAGKRVMASPVDLDALPARRTTGANPGGGCSMRVGILNLDAMIPMYQDGLRYLAHSLLQRGVEVVHLGCGRSLNRCIQINSQPQIVPPEKLEQLKSEICRECTRSQSLVPCGASLLVAKQDNLSPRQVDFLNEVRRLLSANPTAAVILDQAWEGVEICKLAFFEFSMVGKVSEISILSDVEILRLTQHIEDTLRLMNFFRRAGRAYDFDKIVYVNGNYSAHTLVREVLRDRCRQFVSFEFQFSSHGLLNRIFFEQDRIPVQPKWKSVTKVDQNYNQRKVDARAALRSFRNRFLGIDYNSYTKPTSCEDKDRLELFRKRYPKIVSYFSCSSDELRSHFITHGTKLDQSFFNDQIELITAIVDNACDETGYVIRVHPRLAPNKRDRTISREIRELDKIIEMVKDRANFLMIPAQSPLSSYQLVTNSDLVVVSWSTVALESMVAGKPAFVLFPQNCNYPAAELCEQPRSKDEFIEVVQGRRNMSDYKLHDARIIRWISMVYSSLSRAVPFPRGESRDLAAKIFRRFFQLVQKSKAGFGIYVWLCSFFFSDAIDALFLENRDVRFLPPSASQLKSSLAELDDFRTEMTAFFAFR
jgi:hypothetical protein